MLERGTAMSVASLGRRSPAEQARPDREGDGDFMVAMAVAAWGHGRRTRNIHCKLLFVAS